MSAKKDKAKENLDNQDRKSRFKKFLIISLLSVASGLLLAATGFGGLFRYCSLIAIVPWILLYYYYEKASIFYILIGSYLFWIIGYRVLFEFAWFIPFVLVIFYFLNFLLFPILFKRMRKAALPLILIVPIIWVFLDWFRLHVTVGLVVYKLGYTMAPHLRLIQIADIGGVYIISFILAAANAFIAELIIGIIAKVKGIGHFSLKRIVYSGSVVAFLFLVSLLYGTWRMMPGDWKEGPRISLIQPYIVHYIDNSAEVYLSSMLQTERDIEENSTDLIVWPEYSIKGEVYKDQHILNDLAWMAQKKNAPMLIGAYGEAKKTKWKMTNSAFMISQEGTILDDYSKIYLVPWGEYIPFDNLVGYFSKTLQVMQRSLARGSTGVEPFIEPGDHIKTMEFPSQEHDYDFSVMICHEFLKPELVREAKNKGANFIINMTSEPIVADYLNAILFDIAVFRTVENKISIVRDGNIGITAFLKPNGQTKSVLKGGESGQSTKITGTLTDRVLINKGETFYSKYGDVFAWLCILLSIVFYLFSFIKKNKS